MTKIPRRLWLLCSNTVIAAATILLFLVLVESLLAAMIAHPSLLRSFLGYHSKPLSALRWVYLREIEFIQVSPDCARYHERFSYILRPGTCTFSSSEFSTTYDINSYGLRDDEASVANPTMVVVGDSFAMGWGVEQDQTFAQLLEHDLGLRTLNAAISSYGTAREMLLFKDLSREAFQADPDILIIQYGKNDYDENKSFVENGGTMPVQERNIYHDTVESYAQAKTYVPGEHSWKLARLIYRRARSMQSPSAPTSAPAADNEDCSAGADRDEARYFLDVLMYFKDVLADTQIIVVETNSYNRNDSRFVECLAGFGKDSKYSDLANVLTPIDLSSSLDDEHYYVLDAHLNAAGHRRIAEVLASEVARHMAH